MANDSNTGTVAVNGQRFLTPTTFAFRPTGYGPQTTGVPMVTPSQPPFVGASPAAAPSSYAQVGGYGTADNNALVTQIAGENPWSLKHSPVLWAVGGLLLSLFLLRHVHWRDTLVEAHGGVGVAGHGASGSAEAG